MDSELDSNTEELGEPVETVPAGPGDRLRSAREEKRLELSHIAAETRIPVRHLQSIESGDFDNLPSRTYAIGFAKTYARSVDLDPEEIAQAVREELADGHAQHSAMAGGMEPGDPAKLPSRGLAWFGGFAAFALAVGVIAFASTYFGAGANPASLIANTEEATDEEALADASNPTQGEGSNAPAISGGQVIFTALEDLQWVRFYDDGGEVLFEAGMATGDTFEVPEAAVDPRINTGRPDLFSITIGGQSVPKLAEEPITLGDAPISADALLARSDLAGAAQSVN
ncbi:RodZ domain-containing protein [Erythrobacter sp. Alg231-14]|uniref:RodZ domain-containing protein n=1 Tax=Erythrobacter sp. Alg231-14 TaxID=1922225 RepID=UPI000D55121F